MLLTVHIIIYIIGLVLLFCAAFGVNSSKISVGWLGLALVFLAQLIHV